MPHQFNNTSKEIAWKLFEENLDMDYMDYADDVEEELEILEKEIQELMDEDKYIAYALDLFATMHETECPIIQEMLKVSKE